MKQILRTFTVLDTEWDEERNDNTYRVYLVEFEGGQSDFIQLSEVYEAAGGCAIQIQLFPLPIPTEQLGMFPKSEIETRQTDPRQLNMFDEEWM